MAKSNTKALSCTITQTNFDALEEYRWSARKNMSEMVDTAIAEFLENHGIETAAPAPAAKAEVKAEVQTPADDKGKLPAKV